MRTNQTNPCNFLCAFVKVLTMASLLTFAKVGITSASIITFDDHSYGYLYNSYAGLNWSNFAIRDGGGNPLFGWYNGMISSPNIANTFGNAEITGPTFNFNSVYLTSAWRNGMYINIQGYYNDVLLYEETVTVNASSPSFFAFNFLEVNRLVFGPFGGTPVNPSVGDGIHIVMDNMDISFVPVPEPSTYLAGICVLGMFGVSVWRNRK